MNKENKLGMGLGALLSTSNNNSESSNGIKKINISQIIPNPSQPRKNFKGKELKELSLSIKNQGLIQPIVVKPTTDNQFQIIAGERRWRACQLNGMHEVECVIKNLEDTEVSLKLNNMNIRSALKLFAGLVQRNIIIGNEVNGEITIDFENIKWGSAVYAILDINSLVMTVDEDSGLLRVHTKEFFAELEKSKIDNTIEQNNNLASLEIGGSVSNDGDSAEPMITEIFKVFYQSSTDLVESLGEIMGEAEGFTMVDDEKNNQIIITGTYAQLNQAENILNKID